MALTRQFSWKFTNSVRSRGRTYFFDGRVRLRSGDANSVVALVSGTEPYHVALSIQGMALVASCSCPDSKACKHIWATMLAAEKQGFLNLRPEPTRLHITQFSEIDEGSDDEDFVEDEEDDFDDEFIEEYDFDDVDDYFSSRRTRQPAKPKPVPVASGKPAGWKRQIEYVEQAMQEPRSFLIDAVWPSDRQIVYLIDAAETIAKQELTVEILYRTQKQNGEWSKPKSQGFTSAILKQLTDPQDQRLVALLLGARRSNDYYFTSQQNKFQLGVTLATLLAPQMCQTGRCVLRQPGGGELSNLEWDGAGAWEFCLEVHRSKATANYVVTGSLRRGDEKRDMTGAAALIPGLVIDTHRMARLDDRGATAWADRLRAVPAIEIPAGQESQLLEKIFSLPRVPPIELDEELRFEEMRLSPRLTLRIKKQKQFGYSPRPLAADLLFEYDGMYAGRLDRRRSIYDARTRRLIHRDHAAEQGAAGRLSQLGFKPGTSYSHTEPPPAFEIWPDKLPRAVRLLVAEGWHVEAEGKLYRQPGQMRIEVSSGIDWFELNGSVQFGDAAASLPALLSALKRGENIVELGDGSFGILPESWLKKYGLIAGLGEAEGDSLHFTRSQVGLLDALLASQPEATFDATFAQARDALSEFSGIRAMPAPAGFVGELRAYQEDGLGWLHFLQRFGYGGCLADDMGLGKTIMALALLESRRELRQNGSAEHAAGAAGDTGRNRKKKTVPGMTPATVPPSLVVVPRSLVFNWKQEAERFAPALRILDHTGQQRDKSCEHFEQYDLVVTTYGTLRRDAVQFKDIEFDYVILDEAQAIKNARTEASKAARLLRGRHRLALSGTPIENHLGELWALFDFLNPGLLGAASVFNLAGLGARDPDEETRTLLARALRPFILRRTKAQVASDLPEKTEQTIFCDMEPPQRKLYDELREHYRRALLGIIDERGLKRAKIQVLEALLRLRQAACHPGLIDKTRISEPSAKLDLLLEQLEEVLDEGHKTLVFSQFTSMLAILRDRLDKSKTPYEYLDGKTRDRAGCVERFQEGSDCKLFLISLKAGGLGLNLTAAEYVFLLDPWWNPAVEAQAIDRAHRIGQTQHVFAYRLIARDTVEEKVLELQSRKRDLADAIINADNSLIRDLAREDLELLLS